MPSTPPARSGPGGSPDTTFPTGFVWGAASSAYQIEGAADLDGKGASIWDVFTHKPGATFMGHTGDVACDHYHRYPEDIALMRQIGLRAYRFSISWPRVLPEGTGPINEAGLSFYDRLVDGLLAADIQPWVTLFHWDYPQALYQRGGWLNRESPEWFAEYARVVVDRLSDRVSNWITINEPQIYLGPDHGDACGAPGMRPTTHERLITAHHTLMAHGRAVQVIRAHARKRPRSDAPSSPPAIARRMWPRPAASPSGLSNPISGTTPGSRTRWSWARIRRMASASTASR
jgi:beta-glucosidase